MFYASGKPCKTLHEVVEVGGYSAYDWAVDDIQITANSLGRQFALWFRGQRYESLEEAWRDWAISPHQIRKLSPLERPKGYVVGDKVFESAAEAREVLGDDMSRWRRLLWWEHANAAIYEDGKLYERDCEPLEWYIRATGLHPGFGVFFDFPDVSELEDRLGSYANGHSRVRESLRDYRTPQWLAEQWSPDNIDRWQSYFNALRQINNIDLQRQQMTLRDGSLPRVGTLIAR